MRNITIDGSRISTRGELFDTIYSALGIQGTPGRSLDALHDVLTSLGVGVTIENEDALRLALGSYFDRLSVMLGELECIG